MKTIKIPMNDKFLEKVKQYSVEDGWLYTWRTSTGCKFQDIQTFYPHEWISMKPESVFSVYKRNPNARVLFALIGNCLKSYSRGKIKNIYLEVWK